MSATTDHAEAIAELRGIVRRFLSDRADLTQARRLLEGEGYDAAIWSTMADQLGLQSLTIDEENGGAGRDEPGRTRQYPTKEGFAITGRDLGFDGSILCLVVVALEI